MTLFQLVPVMCHMVMYPVRTFSIVVQYLCSLFIIVLSAYQLTMCCCSCSCCERDHSSSKASGENGSPKANSDVDEELVASMADSENLESADHSAEEEPKSDARVQDQEPPKKHAQEWYVYGIQACMSLLDFVLILLIGFLYFAVTFMGVNPTTLTMFVITIITAILSTTIGDRLSEWLGKVSPSERKTS